jgi:hypothetical protein
MHVRLSLGVAFVILAGAGLSSVGCSLDSAAPIVPCTRYGSYVIGDVLRDSVVSTSCRESDLTYENLYRFQLAAQTKLRVSLSSPLDTAFLHVTDSAGVLVVNSVYSSSVDTAATLRLILKPGTYYLGVNSWHSRPSGRFTVSSVVDNSPAAGCAPIWLTTGVATTQAITTSDCTSGPRGAKYYYHPYLLVILANKELAFTEHSASFPPQVVVVNSSGATVGTSAMDTTGTNGMVDFTPAAEDLLLLWVGSSDSLQTGPYTLTIR